VSATMVFQRRSIPGSRGGRPLIRRFYFAPRDGNLYPSESAVIRAGRTPPPRDQKASWVWAISHASLNGLWIVVPLNGRNDVERASDAKSIAASINRTAARMGESLTAQRLPDTIYFTPISSE
jgi:hypothetical protein